MHDLGETGAMAAEALGERRLYLLLYLYTLTGPAASQLQDQAAGGWVGGDYSSSVLLKGGDEEAEAEEFFNHYKTT